MAMDPVCGKEIDEAAARVDELEGFFDELIAHLKAIQEAHTDEWEKPWP